MHKNNYKINKTSINNLNITIMREIDFVTEGYVFDNESKKLASYKLLKAHFTMSETMIKYECILGGVEKTIESDDLKVYKDEDAYTSDAPKQANARMAYRIRRLLNYNNDNSCWTYSDGESVKVDASSVALVYDATTGKLHTVDGKMYCAKREQVWKYHDLEVVREDGTIETIECIAKKIALTDEQKNVIEELRAVWKKAHEAGLELYTEYCNGRLMALNTQNIGEFHNDYLSQSEDCGEVYDITDMATEVCRGVWDRYEENSIYVNK